MPRAPITSRILFWEYLPGSSVNSPGKKQIRLLDFCAVETELGTMVEPRQHGSGSLGNKTTDVDAYDADYTEIRYMDSGTFRNQYGSGGVQWTTDYSA